MSTNISTANDCMVGVQGKAIVVMNPKVRFTADEARRFAAWLVVMSDVAEPLDANGADDAFEQVLAAVQGT